jgi:hypothetical protein
MHTCHQRVGQHSGGRGRGGGRVAMAYLSPTRRPTSDNFFSRASIESTRLCEYWTISEKRNEKDARLICEGTCPTR